jgi:hypothetical protein
VICRGDIAQPTSPVRSPNVKCTKVMNIRSRPSRIVKALCEMHSEVAPRRLLGSSHDLGREGNDVGFRAKDRF